MKKIFPKPFIFSLILFVPLVMSTTVFCEETYVFVLKWGELGSGDGQFQYPGGIDLDINGIVYVTDLFNHRIQKFDSKGNFLAKWGSYGSGDGQFKYPQGIAIDFIGNVCVADHGNHRVQKFDTDGHFLVKWGSFGS
ncbi:MAG: SMP-30/gluconolactonase/LRE family protein, partial [Candidatus Aminicenantes bacterium]